jgi:hypothetical protein
MQEAFNVYLNNKRIDTVHYQDDFTAEEVKRSLISHDGYDSNIKVVKTKRLRNLRKEQKLLNDETMKELTNETDEEYNKRLKELR